MRGVSAEMPPDFFVVDDADAAGIVGDAVEPGAESQVANAAAVVAARAERHRAADDGATSVRSAKPAVVPRSSARIVPWAVPNDCAAAGLASAAGRVKVVVAMMVSVEGVVVVRTAAERFLAELSVVVRL